MSKKQRVNVNIRVRPALNNEDRICVSVEKNLVEIFNHRNVYENIQYDFAGVYGESATQQEIYVGCVKPLLSKCLDGQNLSIFCYGPTGAGKTHTMLGSPQDPGIIPRVITDLFQQISEANSDPDKAPQWKYAVKFSYLEIYNEKVQDLLEPKDTDLPIRENAEKNIFVVGLAEKEINSFDEFKCYFGPASNNRTVAATRLNDHSSRSHSLLLLKVKRTETRSPWREYHGKVYLIDLAGSEDNRKTGNQGIRLKESGAINKSLFALGEVVDAINMGLPRIPYRNSKLTRLLQDSIGGGCHSVMITNIAPEEKYYYDTYCTLNMASKSKKIVNTTSVRETVIAKEPLKRKISDSKLGMGKKRKLESPVSSVSMQSKTTESSPFLSPILKHQTDLEESVNQRLTDLENMLISQMRQRATTPLKVKSGSPGNVTDMEKELAQTRKQLDELRLNYASMKKKLHGYFVNNIDKEKTLNVICDDNENYEDKNKLSDEHKVKNKNEKKLASTKVSRNILQDSSSCNVDECLVSDTPTLSASPLFAPLNKLRRKGFKSTAAKLPKSENQAVPETPVRQNRDDPLRIQVSAVVQQKHNAEILSVLNTGTVKELMLLHTVGMKRAKLIHGWREQHESFKDVEELKDVHGFTAKYVEGFIRSNLIAKISIEMR